MVYQLDLIDYLSCVEQTVQFLLLGWHGTHLVNVWSAPYTGISGLCFLLHLLSAAVCHVMVRAAAAAKGRAQMCARSRFEWLTEGKGGGGTGGSAHCSRIIGWTRGGGQRKDKTRMNEWATPLHFSVPRPNLCRARAKDKRRPTQSSALMWKGYFW